MAFTPSDPPRTNQPGETARMYHELSSYSFGLGDLDPTPADHPLVRRDFVPNDVPTLPAPFKAYAPGLPRIALPRTWTSPETSATRALAGQTALASRRLDVADIARLLYLSAAFVRFAERRDGRRYFFRTSRSAT